MANTSALLIWPKTWEPRTQILKDIMCALLGKIHTIKENTFLVKESFVTTIYILLLWESVKKYSIPLQFKSGRHTHLKSWLSVSNTRRRFFDLYVSRYSWMLSNETYSNYCTHTTSFSVSSGDSHICKWTSLNSFLPAFHPSEYLYASNSVWKQLLIGLQVQRDCPVEDYKTCID